MSQGLLICLENIWVLALFNYGINKILLNNCMKTLINFITIHNVYVVAGSTEAEQANRAF